MKKILLYLLVFLALETSAQKKYFYSSVKLPLGEYIASLITKGDIDLENSEGALFDFGYSAYNSNNFAVETGLEYYVINPFQKHYYINSSGFEYDELLVNNSAFAFQIKPVLKIPIAENSHFRVSTTFNYQKLFSTGKFYLFESPQSAASSSTRSSFKIGLQPALGVDFISNEKLGFGLDLVYMNVNWTESMQKLKFSNQTRLSIPAHQTSNVFIALKFIFR